MNQHSFGYWLKLKRKALDLTREELAKRVGYSAATIRKIEDEERHPSAQVAERMAEFFKIPENLIVKFNPDEYQYTITVDMGVIYHTVRTNDTTMPSSLRPLVEELSALQTFAH